jgi:hypothetical protein
VSGRPQNKNLIPLTERSEEEAHAIRSAGGKAVQEKKKQQKLMTELLTIYSDLPITDKKRKGRLKRLGIKDDDLTQKTLIADAIMRAAQGGNTYAIQLYLDLVGESGLGGLDNKNNLLEALIDQTKEDINTDDIPELQQAAESDADVVE